MAEKPNDLWFPDGYGQDTADTICDRLADGESLRKICRDDDMPSTSTVCKWLAKNDEFAEQYTRARELQADALFDDCLDIADQYDQAADNGEGGNEVIQRAKLRIDTRKWMAGKLKGKYSDKVKHVGGDEDDSPIETVTEVKLVGFEG